MLYGMEAWMVKHPNLHKVIKGDENSSLGVQARQKQQLEINKLGKISWASMEDKMR